MRFVYVTCPTIGRDERTLLRFNAIVNNYCCALLSRGFVPYNPLDFYLSTTPYNQINVENNKDPFVYYECRMDILRRSDALHIVRVDAYKEDDPRHKKWDTCNLLLREYAYMRENGNDIAFANKAFHDTDLFPLPNLIWEYLEEKELVALGDKYMRGRYRYG